MHSLPDPSWPDAILDQLLALDVRQVAYVPDAGHRRLIDACGEQPQLRRVSLTSEQEGVALLAGAWLGGQRGVLLMQSSGVGNCVNMLSLTQTCRFPLLMLITMRGQWGEFNPWQIPMGQRTPEVLAGCEVLVYPVSSSPNRWPRRWPPPGVSPFTAIARRRYCCRSV